MYHPPSSLTFFDQYPLGCPSFVSCFPVICIFQSLSLNLSFFFDDNNKKKKQTVSPIDAVLSTFWLPNVSPLETCRRSATGPCENKRLFLAADGTVPSTSSFRPSFLLPNFVVCFEILDCRILVHVGRLVGRCRVVERRGPKNISTSTGDENGRLVRSIFNAAD